MGRPVNKRKFGDPATKTGDQFYIQAWFEGSTAGAEEQCFIVKQTGTRHFRVESVSNNDQGEVKLVDFSLGAISAGEGYIEAAGEGTWSTIAGQDETNYDNSPTTEGTFTAGSGYANGEVMTMSDGTTVTTTSTGAVVNFTITTASLTGSATATTLTQTSTTGTGTGFELIQDVDNEDQFAEDYVFLLSNKNVKVFGGTGRKKYQITTSGAGSSTQVDLEGT